MTTRSTGMGPAPRRSPSVGRLAVAATLVVAVAALADVVAPSAVLAQELAEEPAATTVPRQPMSADPAY